MNYESKNIRNIMLAGHAGSGKTTVLVNRIVYLIKYGNAYADETLPEDADGARRALAYIAEYPGISYEEVEA